MLKQHCLKYSFFSATVLCGIYYSRNLNDKHIKMGIAGLLAQMTTDLIFHPIDVVNTRTKYYFREKLNIRQMSKKIYYNEGLFGIYRAGSVMLWGSAFSGYTYFFLYKIFKEFFKNKFGENSQYRSFVYALSAMITQCFVYPLVYPIDLVKTRLQTGEYNYLNLQEGIKQIYLNSNKIGMAVIREFYVGFIPNFSLSVTSSILVFLTFESTRDFIAKRKNIKADDVIGLDYLLCTFMAGSITAISLNALEVYSILKCIHGDRINFRNFLSKENSHALKSGICARLFSGVFYTIFLLELVNTYGKVFQTNL